MQHLCHTNVNTDKNICINNINLSINDICIFTCLTKQLKTQNKTAQI